MEIIQNRINSETVNIYTIFDTHFGAANQREKEFRELVKIIEKDKNGYWIGGGDYCMPLDTEILTNRGFITQDKLTVNDSILSYNNGKLVWGKLNGIYKTPKVKMNRLKSRSFDIKCSPNHRWIVEYDRTKEIKIVHTKDLYQHHRIITSAVYSEDGDSNITPEESAILGWLITDGNVRNVSENGINGCVVQGKAKQILILDELLKDWITKKYKMGDCFAYNIKASKLRELFNKCGVVKAKELKEKLPAIVPNLSLKARRSMLEAMLLAEGWKNESGNWIFSQSHKNQNVLNIFYTLAVMEGYRCSIEKYNKNKVLQITLMTHKKIGVSDLVITEEKEEEAWCPMTEFGNWICKQGNQVTLTGNCEAITLNDKRFSPGELQRKYNLRDLNDLPRKQMKEFYDAIKPIRSRCLGLLIGNHEEKYIKYNHFDVYDYLATDLMENHGLKMGGNGYILLNMGKGCRRNVKIFCTHGEGVSTSPDDGSVINSLKRLCADKIADIYLAGHVHRLLTSVEDMIDIDSAGNVYYPRKVYGIGGAWLKKYQIGNSGYFESRRGNETPAGYLKLCLSTSNQNHKLEIKPEIHYL